MSEQAKNLQTNPGFELPKNQSVLDASEIETFELGKFPEKQFFLAQLASFVMPVAPVTKKDGKLQSVNVKYHQNYDDPENHDDQLVNRMFLNYVFDDHDKASDWNVKNGIVFDFDAASFNEDSVPIDYYLQSKKNKERIFALLKPKIDFFVSMIEGENGLNFLAGLLKKSGYKGDASKIQSVLLSRCKNIFNVVNNQYTYL